MEFSHKAVYEVGVVVVMDAEEEAAKKQRRRISVTSRVG